MTLQQILRKDTELLAWSATFAAKITAGNPANYGLDAELANDYVAKQTSFADKMLVVQDRDGRTRTDTIRKNEARDALVAATRELIAICEVSPLMDDVKRSELNIPIKDREPTPQPRPSTAPVVEVLNQRGLTVTIGLRDVAESTRRRRPDGVIGATILTHVGEDAPATIDGWTFQGNTSKTTAEITFGPLTPRGAKVWVTAVWYNRRSESGPPSRPMFTYVAGADGLALAA